ncbi:kinesin-like protein KIF14 isoform X2 [Saccopteryx leptura]|uniref:kinesin-like protein KIF14 isoform X2 n=1 Tax=Saccopteryx leptura TaxID=249018 RepID=UPI00339D067E
MSVPTVPRRNISDALDASRSRRSASLNDLSHNSSLKLLLKSDMSECENDEPLLRSARKIKDINCTYVISACQTPGGTPLAPNPVGRLTLQRRVTRNKDSSLLGSGVGESAEKGTETRLTLQRRPRTGPVDKGTPAWNVAGTAGSNCTSQEMGTNVKMVNGDKCSLAASAIPSAEDTNGTDLRAETFPALRGADDSVAPQCLSHSTPIHPQSQPEVVWSGRLAAKPLPCKLDITVSGTGSFHHRNIGKGVAKNTNKFDCLKKRTPTKCVAEHGWTPWCGTPQLKSPAASMLRRRTPSSQVKPKPQSSLLTNKRERSQEHTLPPKEDSAVQSTSPERDSTGAESSQVTVAVRVRPFSRREKAESASQAVFLNGEEIAVRHPDMRHVYTFMYDVSFWSFDDHHPNYAGQTTVYETLAAPLLARALEGYNACLFAYGQTGSGKSYTMMGFGEEPGIIPRFCEDLFAQVAKRQTQEVRYHLEMSFFEVYNEKIHDLLVCKGENGQRKQPLRVREHPVSGPYVEALAVNVVGSYSDVQGWLELGSKQRATAATGMNDKSSRSHAVVTLVMTRTQTELVDGEDHVHRVTSHIHLVDLAGSERCGSTRTSGQQLREGVSINKSLLTLGKVISALAEHGSRRMLFIPYRESVLTWLLKESLGGNSKTVMIATVSPAASSVEETLSTLRYAHQARRIINVARVNEDMSAQLIRELKAEIEKLKAAQRSRQHGDPEWNRLCRQEVTSLRMKLHQQERDMAEMQRMWKEKFEQAEKRKHEEIKELQKAGITFQVDNHLPNLVNLSEDPQLSEMLLYVIKEGTTTVGKRRPTSRPDIQLSGVLVADDHCMITNVDGIVSIVPIREAKTYVNGRHILEPTVLHHGDRVVLGGDHYFRFNHPVEVQTRPFTGGVPTSEGPKDFDFAKNELLVAQRAQLEAEVQEARLQAKQEMLQGVQIAREVAEQELSSQRAAYESRIEALEAELKEESHRKKMQELSHREASHRIEELERAKQCLEQEVHASRKWLAVQCLAAKQALEDHSIRHTRILEALEAEKQKIAKEVQILQHSHKNKTLTIPTSWSSMKLSMMLQEANAISSRLKRYYVFGRHEPSDKGSGPDPCVRVQNLRLGVSTFWSLEKFESKLAAMKELYESNCANKCDDLFCDPEDEWEPDITNASLSSFSRRRSRSLVKDRRISGYLHDVQASSASTLPRICRELISSSLAVLGESHEGGTVADSLVGSFLAIHSGLLAIAQAYEEQDEESQDDLFSSDCMAQAQTVRVACAFGQLTALLMYWLVSVSPSTGTDVVRLADELRQEVKMLGGHLQVFLQGCCADIPSMVKDTRKKAVHSVQQAMKCVGQLVVLQGNELCLPEAGIPEEFVATVRGGVGSGLETLLASGVARAQEIQRELLRQCPQDQVTQRMNANAQAFVGALESVFAEWKTRNSRCPAQEGGSGYQDLKKMVDCAPKLLKLQHCLEQAFQIVIPALRGCAGDGSQLRSCVESVCSLARSLPTDGCRSRGDLQSAAKSLLLSFESEEGPDLLKPQEMRDLHGSDGRQQCGLSRTGSSGRTGIPKRVCQLPSRPRWSSEGHVSSRTRWV